MYYNRSRSPAPLSGTRPRAKFSSGLSYSSLSNDVPGGSFLPRNTSVHRLMNTDFRIRDRSASPSRDYSAMHRTTNYRHLPSVLSVDSSPVLRRRDLGYGSRTINDSLGSPVSWCSAEDFSRKPRSYYDFATTSTPRYSAYSAMGLNRPHRTDYSDYLRPALSERPALRSDYTPRPRAERENTATPLVRERKLVKFRELTDDILTRVKRKISWDLPEEIKSPLINEMRDSEKLNSVERARSRDSSLTRQDSKFPTSCISDSRSPTPSTSRRHSDHSLDRMSPKNLMRLKSPRNSDIGIPSESNLELSVPLKVGTELDASGLSRIPPQPRKKSIPTTQITQKSPKSTDGMTFEQKSLNYSIIADQIRRRKCSTGNSQLLQDMMNAISSSNEQNRDEQLTVSDQESSKDSQSILEPPSPPDDGKPSVESSAQEEQVHNERRRIRENLLNAEKNDRSRSRTRTRSKTDDISFQRKSSVSDDVDCNIHPPISHMHRKSVKYKANEDGSNHFLKSNEISKQLLEPPVIMDKHLPLVGIDDVSPNSQNAMKNEYNGTKRAEKDAFSQIYLQSQTQISPNKSSGNKKKLKSFKKHSDKHSNLSTANQDTSDTPCHENSKDSSNFKEASLFNSKLEDKTSTGLSHPKKEPDELIVVCKLPVPKKKTEETKHSLNTTRNEKNHIDQNIVVSIAKSCVSEESFASEKSVQQISTKSGSELNIPTEHCAKPKSSLITLNPTRINRNPSVNVMHTVVLKPKTRNLNLPIHNVEKQTSESINSTSLESITDLVESTINTEPKLKKDAQKNSNLDTTLHAYLQKSSDHLKLKKESELERGICNQKYLHHFQIP